MRSFACNPNYRYHSSCVLVVVLLVGRSVLEVVTATEVILSSSMSFWDRIQTKSRAQRLCSYGCGSSLFSREHPDQKRIFMFNINLEDSNTTNGIPNLMMYADVLYFDRDEAQIEDLYDRICYVCLVGRGTVATTMRFLTDKGTLRESFTSLYQGDINAINHGGVIVIDDYHIYEPSEFSIGKKLNEGTIYLHTLFVLLLIPLV